MCRVVVLRCLREVCADGQLLVDLFVNYDCDLDSSNLFERLVNGLVKMAQYSLRLDLFSTDHILTTNKPLQGSFESVPRPPLQAGLGTLIWSAFGARSRAIAAFSPAQTNRAKRENEL